jgi:hypothetical protein
VPAFVGVRTAHAARTRAAGAIETNQEQLTETIQIRFGGVSAADQLHGNVCVQGCT